MPRPTTKKDLRAQSHSKFEALKTLIDDLSPVDRERDFRPGSMNRNIRDVLGHLHHWHMLMLGWYAVGMKGSKPDMPAKGYTWATTPELNRLIHARYSAVRLKKVQVLFERSHTDVMALIERHSDVELFTKKRYPWTGTTSLGAYMVGATSSHYEWALKLIRKGLK